MAGGLLVIQPTVIQPTASEHYHVVTLALLRAFIRPELRAGFIIILIYIP